MAWMRSVLVAVLAAHAVAVPYPGSHAVRQSPGNKDDTVLTFGDATAAPPPSPEQSPQLVPIFSIPVNDSTNGTVILPTPSLGVDLPSSSVIVTAPEVPIITAIPSTSPVDNGQMPAAPALSDNPPSPAQASQSVAPAESPTSFSTPVEAIPSGSPVPASATSSAEAVPQSSSPAAPLSSDSAVPVSVSQVATLPVGSVSQSASPASASEAATTSTGPLSASSTPNNGTLSASSPVSPAATSSPEPLPLSSTPVVGTLPASSTVPRPQVAISPLVTVPAPKGKNGGPYSADQEHPIVKTPPTPKGPIGIPGAGYVPKNGTNFPKTQNPSPKSQSPGPVTLPRLKTAPPGCKTLPNDAEWPEKAVWNRELKGWEPIMASGRNRHPQVMFEVKSVQAVQRAVKFAAKYNIRLSIVNSGHDFLGRNDAPSGILLDISGLKGVRVESSFTPKRRGVKMVGSRTTTNTITYQKGAAVTFGGGITTAELNDALGQSNMWTVGAAHGEVTVAGGWAQAGGHGTLTHQYGLGADNALEFKVVTAAGNLVVANAVVNQDLYWALRGGGGSTFGVVVEATFKAYAMPTVYSYQFFLNTTNYNDQTSIFAPAAYLASQMPRILDQGGMAGYIYLHPNAIRAQLYAPNKFANATNMKAIMDPILARMATMPGMTPELLFKYPPYQGSSFSELLSGRTLPPMPGLSSTNLGYPLGKVPREPWMPGRPTSGFDSLLGGFGGSNRPSSFDTAFQSTKKVQKRHEPGGSMRVPRGIQSMDSRMLGRNELASPDLAEALRKTMPFTAADGQIRFHLVSGPKVWEQGLDSAVNPAWRKTYAHVLATGGGTPNAQPLRDISPDMGAYFNEASIHNPNWKHDFFGTNYPRLSQIKSRWDPNMVFYVTPGVNADHIVVKGDRVCRVQGPYLESADRSPPLGDNKNIAPHVKDYVSFPQLYKNIPISSTPSSQTSQCGGFFGSLFGGLFCGNSPSTTSVPVVSATALPPISDVPQPKAPTPDDPWPIVSPYASSYPPPRPTSVPRPYTAQPSWTSIPRPQSPTPKPRPTWSEPEDRNARPLPPAPPRSSSSPWLSSTRIPRPLPSSSQTPDYNKPQSIAPLPTYTSLGYLPPLPVVFPRPKPSQNPEFEIPVSIIPRPRPRPSTRPPPRPLAPSPIVEEEQQPYTTYITGPRPTPWIPTQPPSAPGLPLTYQIPPEYEQPAIISTPLPLIPPPAPPNTYQPPPVDYPTSLPRISPRPLPRPEAEEQWQPIQGQPQPALAPTSYQPLTLPRISPRPKPRPSPRPLPFPLPQPEQETQPNVYQPPLGFPPPEPETSEPDSPTPEPEPLTPEPETAEPSPQPIPGLALPKNLPSGWADLLNSLNIPAPPSPPAIEEPEPDPPATAAGAATEADQLSNAQLVGLLAELLARQRPQPTQAAEAADDTSWPGPGRNGASEASETENVVDLGSTLPGSVNPV